MNFRTLLDPFIVIPLFGLSGISLALLGSTNPELFNQQLAFFVLGFILFILFASIDFYVWKEFTLLFYLLTIIALIVPFFGESVRGTNRWIDLGAFRFQPSEIVKPFVVSAIAHLISKLRSDGLKYFWFPLIALIPIAAIVFQQPDLGNVIVFLVTFFALQIAAGLPWSYLVILVVVFGSALPGVFFLLKSYQKARLISFLSPHSDPQGVGYNALQSIIAIGSGQLFGLGLGRGTQSRLRFLPEHYTDFIFASLGEELGFIGGLLVIIFYFTLLLRILFIANFEEDNYAKLFTIGIFAQILTQVVVNIGMNLGILPITGITLPLLSYGGSSIISTFIALGMIASIYRKKKLSPLVIK